MNRKVSATPRKTSSSGNLKDLLSPGGGVYELPGATVKNGVLVPFALTACIPESAVRKFAAKIPFVVEVNDDSVKSFVFYFGD
jgi:hypothetical protein